MCKYIVNIHRISENKIDGNIIYIHSLHNIHIVLKVRFLIHINTFKQSIILIIVILITVNVIIEFDKWYSFLYLSV